MTLGPGNERCFVSCVHSPKRPIFISSMVMTCMLNKKTDLKVQFHSMKKERTFVNLHPVKIWFVSLSITLQHNHSNFDSEILSIVVSAPKSNSLTNTITKREISLRTNSLKVIVEVKWECTGFLERHNQLEIWFLLNNLDNTRKMIDQ
jgi:hypothetical protein